MATPQTSVLTSEQLTVCIPIEKEVKLHVKPSCEAVNDNTEIESNEKDTRSIGGTAVLAEEKANAEATQSAQCKSPTLSLLRAQDLMFDPKFMYKEYNLRRVRVRKDVEADQSPPQKRKKVEKPSSASKEKKGSDLKEKQADQKEAKNLDEVVNQESPSDESSLYQKNEGDSTLPRGEELQEKEVPRTANNAKRGISAEGELSCELPKLKHGVEESMTDAINDGCIEQQNDKGCSAKKGKRLLDYPVLISRKQPRTLATVSVTLTQLLSTPKTSEQQKQVPPTPTRREIEKCSTTEKVTTKLRYPPKNISPAVGGQVASGRSQLTCTLCKLKGGVSSLGFLFGPYFCHTETDCNDECITASDNTEVWLHEDCAVWAPGVCLVGRELQGLREALDDASKMVRVHHLPELAKDCPCIWVHNCYVMQVCTVCKNSGATLFCASRGCKNVFHFPCAMERGNTCMINYISKHD